MASTGLWTQLLSNLLMRQMLPSSFCCPAYDMAQGLARGAIGQGGVKPESFPDQEVSKPNSERGRTLSLETGLRQRRSGEKWVV